MTVTALRTRQPSGKPPWPLVLIEGGEKTGKTYQALEFTGDERIGRSLALDLGEGCADEYGAIPGARFEVIDHDGTWSDIIGQLEAAVAASHHARDTGEPPMLLVVDSGSSEWDMLKGWVDVRARRQRSNAEKLRKDPDAEIKASRNLWNDAEARHNRFMKLLREFHGPVIVTARGKWVSATGKDGQPIPGEKDYRVEGHKNIGYAANAWVRLSREEPPTVVGLRSVQRGIRPGIDEVVPWRDFNLGELIFQVIGCDPGDTAARNQPELNADQVMPEEIPPAPEDTEPDGDNAPEGWRAPGRQQQRAGVTPINRQRKAPTEEENAEIAARGLVGLLSAETADAARELRTKAQDHPCMKVDVLLMMDNERELLGLGPQAKTCTLKEAAALIISYVEREGMSVASGRRLAEAEESERSADTDRPIGQDAQGVPA